MKHSKRRERGERPEKNPEITSLVALVCIASEFKAEIKEIKDKQNGVSMEHVQFTFFDPKGKDRNYLEVHDHREATLKAMKALGNREMTEVERKQLLGAVNVPAYVTVRENNAGFDYVVFKPAWTRPAGMLLASAVNPGEVPPSLRDGDKTLWSWRTGFNQSGLTVLKLIETKKS